MMSEGYAAPPPPPPAPRARPAVVTAASLLILLLFLAAVAYLVASIAVAGDLVEAFEEAYSGTEIEEATGLLGGGQIAVGAVYLLVAATLVVLSIFNNQGRNGSRIATWIVGGLAACCGGASLISTAVGDVATTQPQGADLPDPSEVERIIEEHLPGWFGPVTLTASAVGLLALIAALILLALPPANVFFRRPAQPTEPPPGYPPVG